MPFTAPESEGSPTHEVPPRPLPGDSGGGGALPSSREPPGHLQPGQARVSENTPSVTCVCARVQSSPGQPVPPSGTAEPDAAGPHRSPTRTQDELPGASEAPSCLPGHVEPCPWLTRERSGSPPLAGQQMPMFPCDDETEVNRPRCPLDRPSRCRCS